MLELRGVAKVVEGQAHIAPTSLILESGSLNVLLGPSLSGKTSLLRLMAGLDKPTAGTVWEGGKDVTGVGVRQRNIAMVYQQFVNYPAMTVYENIASPLRLARTPAAEIERKVRGAADLLRLTPYLDRTPLTLSGGQQQRTALARALVKQAGLVLLDEPLANLDYKLREELREELPKIFAQSGAILVYATTEPSEALLLGGNTATLHEGHVTQFGPTIEVFRKPHDLTTARAFSDPPLNTIAASKAGAKFTLESGPSLPAPKTLADGPYVLGVRPHHLALSPQDTAAVPLDAQVSVTEITGIESFVHFPLGGTDWVMLTPGVHEFEPGETIKVYVDAPRVMVFAPDGQAFEVSDAVAAIKLDHIRHAYGPNPASPADYALKEVDHVFEDGSAYALLGPSGCGKTTLLNIISGLIHPSEGRLLFDDKDVTELSTGERNIAQVFQFPVVYDTMTVAENLAFPLRNRHVPAAEIKTRVASVLEMIGLSDMANKKARGLNADQKQKISLGRGLVRSDVGAILFDEPLTVIDPHMKWVLRSQLKQLHAQVGRTMIYVTHDQTEALTFAEKVVVMYDGEIVQIGDAAQLFNEPAHTFVGYFIGSPGMNVLPVTVQGRKAMIGAQGVALPPGVKIPEGKTIELGVRPEHLTLGRAGMPITIDRVEDVGRRRIVRARLEGHDLAIAAPEDSEIPANPHVQIEAGKFGMFADSWRLGAAP